MRIDQQDRSETIQETLKGLYRCHRGRPSYPPLVMFKAFLLQSWYNLSDPGLKVRSAVERVFGTLKRHYGMERVHYVGLMRNRAHLILMGICYNLKKMLTLEAA